MAESPICEVCGKPEAHYEDHETDGDGAALCWEAIGNGHPQHAIDALREARADRDRLRALLAAYGRAVEETARVRGDPERYLDAAAVECEAERAVRAEAAKWREWG